MPTVLGTQQLVVNRDGTVRTRRKLSGTARCFLGLGWLIWAVVVRLPRSILRFVARRGWRNRWHLAPLAGGAWALWYGPAVPVLALPLLGGVALAAGLGARTGIRLGRRMWLGKVERYALAEGAVGAGLWTAGEWGAAAAGVPLPPIVSYGLYVLLTGHAAWQWWASRRPSWWPRRVSGEAALYAGQWALVAEQPGGLQDSHVVHATIEATDDGDVTFDVEVAGHADNVDEASRLVVESTIKVQDGASLPHRSVTIAAVDRNVKRVRVTISPGRAMEDEPVASGGLEPLARDGSLLLAVDSTRRPVRVHRFSKTGVRHAMISGGTDAGKSNTLSRLVLPGLLTINDRGLPIETCWSLDGGRGTSTPYLNPAFDIAATQPWQFPILIEAAYAVHLARENRRGQAGRYDWRTWEEDDPILTLLIQEARGVAPYLTARQHRMYASMAMRARKIGMSLIQEGQDFARGNAVGGEDMPEVRKQLANGGVVLAHRDGENDQRTLQGSHDAVQLVRGVNSLPAGGGWHLPMEQGKLLAKRARTVWDDVEDRAAAARSVTPRPLAGADWEAACTVDGFRELYEHRHDPTWEPKPEADTAPDEALTSGPRPFVPVQPARELADARVLRAITEHMAKTGDPLGKTQAEKDYGIPGGTWELGRGQLVAEGKIHQPTPGKWAPGPSPEG